MRKTLIVFFIFIQLDLFAANELEIGREFGLFTSKNLSGYLKPFLTTFNQSLNSNLYTVANYNNGWSFGIDISASEMFIPESQKNFEAELPKAFGNTDIVLTAQRKNNEIILNTKGTVTEPTIYGGISSPVFASPQNSYLPDSLNKTVAFAEGNNIDFISGLPAIQLFVGLPTRTQLRFRFLSFPLLNVPTTYFAIGLTQNISRTFGIFDYNSPYSLGANLMYHKISRNPSIDISSYALGLVFSGNSDFGLGFYSGVQYEGITGNITAVRKNTGTDEFVNNPYDEVRKGDPLIITMDTYTNLKLLLGFSYRIGIVEVHLDGALASQPTIAGGVSLWLFDSGEQIEVFEPIQIPEITPAPEPKIVSLPVEQKEITAAQISKQKIPIKSSIEIVDENGQKVEKIKVEIYRSRQLRAFLPYIFYDENQSDIPNKYVQYSTDKAKEFSFKELLGKNSLETYYHILNILGKRLLENPDANLTLIGCNSNTGVEKNNKKLSKLRAEKIRDYFVNVWQVNPNRIKVEARNLPEKFSNIKDPDGIAENRRVEISSDKWEIIAPIVIEDTLRYIKPGNVLVRNDVYSPTEIKDYELSISSKAGSIVNIQKNEAPKKEIKIDLSNKINNLPEIPENINAVLRVENTEETNITPIQTIPVEVERIDSSLNVYNLILFDFNSSELGKANTKISEFINNDISSDAEVKVTGYTDRIGDEKHNKTLSEARAKSTADKLKVSKVEFQGKGEEELLYDNNTPEGRFYCRTVQVFVRQKNK